MHRHDDAAGGGELVTAVLAGGADGLTGVAPAVAVAALFPNGSAVVVPNAGHYPWVENPASVAEALSAFYADGFDQRVRALPGKSGDYRDLTANAAWTNKGMRTRANVLYCQPFAAPPGRKCTGRSHGNAG